MSDNENTIEIPLDEMGSVDVSDGNLEKIARTYFVGNQAIGRKKDVRKILEDKVVDKIGKKGKYLVDKLFELIEGVVVLDRKHYRADVGKNFPIYVRPPDLNALIYALDRVLGKPKQVSLSGSFSLSQLLIKNDGKPTSRIGSGNNGAVSEKSDLLY